MAKKNEGTEVVEKVVMRPLSSLVRNPKNPRKGTKEAIEKLAESIKGNPKFFEARPILLSDRTGQLVIIGGERRSEAAALLKMEAVPTILLSGLTEAEEDEILIKDNTHAGVWDEQKLQAWGKDQLQSWNVDGVKWPKQETQITEDNFDPDKKVKSRVKPGDIWQLGDHRLMCGDSTDAEQVELLMNGEKATLLLTDPPYGVKRDKGFSVARAFGGGAGKKIASRQYNDNWDGEAPSKETFDLICSQAEIAIIFGGNFFTDKLAVNGFWLVWDKHNSMPTFGDCELAWTNIPRKSVKKYDCLYNGLIGKEKERFHPTQKPVKIMAEIMKDFCEEGKTVLDVFGGSGTTLIAAEQLGRKCYMMELDPHYCDVIIDRWEKFTGQKAKKVTG